VTDPYLSVRDLVVEFPTEDGIVRAVDGINFDLERGETLAIVGESGSGKSVTSQAILGLINRKAATISGSVTINGINLVTESDEALRSLRGRDMAMIFQDPLSSLHPFYRIGKQLVEAIQVHQDLSKQDARAQAIDMLNKVGIPSADRRIDDYPHQLSGGMRQRVMIAMALVNSPDLLIADEPTTALDVTVQAQILELIKTLQDEFHTALIVITHDLGVVAEVADQVAVMYGGRLVEKGAVDEVYYRPEMPYTLGLLSSMPRMDQPRTARLDPIPGQPPSLINLPAGCVFRPRCPYKDEVPDNACLDVRPRMVETVPGHEVRCHLPPERRREIAQERLGVLAARGTGD
jgi:peptide/nickel transport system ATP-binding protein